MEYLLGKEIANKIKEDIKLEVANLENKPHLVILLNEEDLSSENYAKTIKKNAENLGIICDIELMKQNEEIYLQRIKAINDDKNIHACLITRPLKKGLDENKIINSLNYSKDVDCINPLSLGRLFSGDESLVPNTSLAMIKLLEANNIPLKGKKVLVVGRSLSVGKPLAMLLLNRHATVTIAHSRTENLQDELKHYDIVCAAVGVPHLLKGSAMKEGAITIDAGIHYLEEGIVGDIQVDEKLKYCSKVPGGVGIITTACLLANVLACYKEVNNG